MSVNKLDALEVSGTPEEIGFAIGLADADSIREAVLPLTEFRNAQKFWKGSSYLKSLDVAARSVFPEYVLELEGMAGGAQVEYETLLIWNCRGDLPLPDAPQFRNPRNILPKAAQSSFILQKKVLLP